MYQAFRDSRHRWLATRWGDHVRGRSDGYGKILNDRAVPVKADVAGDAVLHPRNQLVPAVRLTGLPTKGFPPGPVRAQTTRPRPYTGGRSRAVRRPGSPSTTAGMALTRRMAVAFRPPVLWSPSRPINCMSTV